MRRIARFALLPVALLLLLPSHADSIIVHDPINAAHLLNQLRQLQRQYLMAQQTYELLRQQARYYASLGALHGYYARSWLAQLHRGRGCANLQLWEWAINSGRLAGTAYDRVMRRAEELGCLTDWPETFRADQAKRIILDTSNVNSIRVLGTSREDLLQLNHIIDGQLDYASATSPTGRSQTANLQKIAVNTATIAAQLRDLQRLNGAILEQLTIQNQLHREAIQAALNHEAGRRQNLPAALAFMQSTNYELPFGRATP